jgi:hypothetical protein
MVGDDSVDNSQSILQQMLNWSIAPKNIRTEEGQVPGCDGESRRRKWWERMNVAFHTGTSRTQIAAILMPQNFITWLESQLHFVCSCQSETNYTCDRTIYWRVNGKHGFICTVTSLEEFGGIKWILMNMMGNVSRSLWHIRKCKLCTELL